MTDKCRMLSASIEDYIKAIYGLESTEQKAITKRIAQRLGVKMASVTGMVKHLAAERYVLYKPYYGVRLTEKGRRVAVDLIRRHRVLELFLCSTLGLTWDEVDADADVLEHAVSDRLIERIYDYLGRPEFDPHGSPIPAQDGSLPPQRGVLLDEVVEGTRATVVEVSDRDSEFLRYLTKLGLRIGSEITLRERGPFEGPVTLETGSGDVALSREACTRIRVVLTEDAKPRRKAKRRGT